jgi:arylsulfatase A-like enzyme
MATRPNIVFILTDDHAAHAISAYGSRVNATPNIDRLAREGLRLDNCFCTNALCAPSRASILTGTYSHVNGVTTLRTPFDSDQPTFVSLLHDDGYQTAIFGKWHLGHSPENHPKGFDAWAVLKGQGTYWNPFFFESDGATRTFEGYTTDVITDRSLDWLASRDRERPFCLLVTHKAPHAPWEPNTAHAQMYAEPIPVPETFFDDHEHRSTAAKVATMRVDRDLRHEHLKQDVPQGLSAEDEALWKYQRYLQDYLRCVASVDDNVGRLLDWLDAEKLTDDTIVVYVSDQGFFLGDHGWYDKRFMYEESLRMPFLIRYPREIPAGAAAGEIITNVDFAQTLLDYAGVPAHARMQGRSFRPVASGHPVSDWRTQMYYRYWEHDDSFHHVWAHYGIRTERHKLIYYYADGLGLPNTSDQVFEPEWELFDLVSDPREMCSLHDDPAHAQLRADLEARLAAAQREVADLPASRR